MEDALNELYQDIILEHNRHPRNKFKLDGDAISAQGYNPSCGDDITVFIQLKNDIIEKITFDGEGCAISQASASLMTELLTKKSKADAEKIIDEICSVLNSDSADDSIASLDKYGEISALMGVKKFPMRIKCATLAWHAAKDAIQRE